MVNDPVLDFEKRRNEPARYNRITMVKTIAGKLIFSFLIIPHKHHLTKTIHFLF